MRFKTRQLSCKATCGRYSSKPRPTMGTTHVEGELYSEQSKTARLAIPAMIAL